MAKKKYYVVWEGRKKGIFNNWNDCQKQIAGFQNAVYKSYNTESEAKFAYSNNDRPKISSFQKTNIVRPSFSSSSINKNTISVDAACSGNPGLMEYRGVITQTGEELFRQGPYQEGTNNVGEFLALVHGLAMLLKQKNKMPVYSDSMTAIGWVKRKKCNTKLVKTNNNTHLFELIDRAEKWLQTNKYENQILKWNTKSWGEIPADFGRK